MGDSSTAIEGTTRTPEQKNVLLVAGVGAFMTTLGTGLINVANPEIQTYFGVSLGDAAWVVTSYLIAVSVLLLVFGRLGDAFGYRRLFSVGVLGFAGSSVLCSVSKVFLVLLGCRILQGASAAMLMSMGPALITTSFPPQQRGRALGVLGTATYLGLSAGPIIGGALLGSFGWRSVFWVHVPVSVVCLLCLRSLPPREPENAVRGSIDAISVALWAAFLVPVMLMLSSAGTEGWTALGEVGAGGLAVVSVVLFALRQSRTASPLFSWPLLANGAFRNGTIAAYLLYLVSFLMMFVLPFYLRHEWNAPASTVGMVMTVQPLVMAATAPLSGASADKMGAGVPATAGMAVIGAALVAMGASATVHSMLLLILSLGLFGFGAGLFTTANNSAIMGQAPRAQQGAASAIVAVSRNVGMASGVAMGGALFAQFQKSGENATGALFQTLAVGALVACIGAGFSWSRKTESKAVQVPIGRS